MIDIRNVARQDEAVEISTDPILRDVETDRAPLQAGPLVGHAYLSSFIGREAETAWIRGRLAAGQRLITISGPGGVGKTRLAYAVADSIGAMDRFVDDCVVVPLASVAEARLVIPTIAHAFGVVVENERRPVERLSLALQGRRILLVVDNLEHLIDASVDLHDLLDACPDLALLVTSRRALRLTGEQEFALSPFPVPDRETGVSIEELANSPAISLFVDRAIAALPTFALTQENAASVIEICSGSMGCPSPSNSPPPASRCSLPRRWRHG